VLERINVALGGFLDEIPAEDLPAALLVMQLLGADLAYRGPFMVGELIAHD
jgi:hypothetical protein